MATELHAIDLEAQDDPRTRGIEGYAHMGRLMGERPDVAIFRSFSAFSAENLLYLQAELVALENDLRVAQASDKTSLHAQRRRYGVDWMRLSGSLEEETSEHRGADDGMQWATVLEMRAKLKEYHQALLRHKDITKLVEPRPYALRFFREWMRRTTLGNVRLVGADRDVWSKPADDLICLNETDTSAMQWLVLLYHKSLGRFIHKPDDSKPYLGDSIGYDIEAIEKLSRVLTTVLGGLLPVMSICVLYVAKGTPLRLGLLALFTGFFSLCLAVTTKVKVAEIFGATAAFAAVLVVFVGTAGS